MFRKLIIAQWCSDNQIIWNPNKYTYNLGMRQQFGLEIKFFGYIIWVEIVIYTDYMILYTFNYNPPACQVELFKKL